MSNADAPTKDRDIRFSYIVKITKKTEWNRPAMEKMVKHEKPTEIKEKSYGGSEVAYEREYEMVEVLKACENSEDVYEQHVKNLDLVAVINAVNATPAA